MDKGIKIVAELMDIAARTAPKGAGQDYIEIKIVDNEELGRIAQEMMNIANETCNKGFERDSNNLKDSDALVLIGVKEHPGLGLDCGACGQDSCAEFNKVLKTDTEFQGPNCVIRLLDLGIALGSAVKTAQIHNVDNRIMYRVGVAARNIGLIDSTVVMGIPLSATGKSIYFDR